MAWEQRKAYKYYYQSVWEDGRTVRKYLGRGANAARVAAEVADRQGERACTRQVCLLWSKKMDEMDAPIRQLRKLANQIMQADLLADGFYQSGRVWRKQKRNRHE